MHQLVFFCHSLKGSIELLNVTVQVTHVCNSYCKRPAIQDRRIIVVMNVVVVVTEEKVY